MNRFHAVIFDMDGLLLDSERIALEAFNKTCTYFGLGDQTELFKRCIGTNQTAGERILKDGLEGIADYMKFSRVWDENYRDKTTKKPIPLKEGAVALLNYLATQKIPMAIATSTKQSKAIQKLQDSGIHGMFQTIIGGDQVKNSKPLPDIYLKAAETLGVLPAKCLALEDSENGVRSAVNAGMTVVQIPDLVQPSAEMIKLGHIVLGSLNEVKDFKFQL